MASRPIFIPCFKGELLVKTEFVEFTWFPGMAKVQKQKCIKSLHDMARVLGFLNNPLEVSSKSENLLGVQLSAFNLGAATVKNNRKFTVESAYQSGKIFENGGPYKDLLFSSSLSAKKDARLKNSGKIIGFEFFGVKWDLEPKTAFYDWIYLNALFKNKDLINRLENYDGFTDIEFNPKKSLNCQAYSVALFKSLKSRGLLDQALVSKKSFLEIIKNHSLNNSSENTFKQPRLL